MTMMPEYTREQKLWQQFNLELSVGLGSAISGGEINKEISKATSGLLKCLKNINSSGVVFESVLKKSHEVDPMITNYNIRMRFNKYLSDNGKGSKDFYKLLGDLTNCCENILKEPDKRSKFGHEADTFKAVLKYLK